MPKLSSCDAPSGLVQVSLIANMMKLTPIDMPDDEAAIIPFLDTAGSLAYI